MASWVTHLAIADSVLEALPFLNRRGFAVGSVAPDCNQENEDFTAFIPPREMTHWMKGRVKTPEDAERFYADFFLKQEMICPEHEAFLWGYYAHIAADACFQRMIRDDERVKQVWQRIRNSPALAARAEGAFQTWDSVKILMPKPERLREIAALEAEYLNKNPNSAFFTEILALKTFPRYLDFLPEKAIERKISVMAVVPERTGALHSLISISEEEYAAYLRDTSEFITESIREKSASGLHFACGG